MPALKSCVVIGDRVYCWDDSAKKCVAAKLEIQPDLPVPDEAIKQVMMRLFNLKE
jgi:hypothetical protein